MSSPKRLDPKETRSRRRILSRNRLIKRHASRGTTPSRYAFEFRVGHQFSTREAVHMAVKNYNIRRASEYRVVESDPYKYVCRCKRYDAGCPWSLRVALRTNLGYWYVFRGSGDVPLIIKPVQSFRVLRVSLRGYGRLVALSGPDLPRPGVLERPLRAISNKKLRNNFFLPRKVNMKEGREKMRQVSGPATLYRTRSYLGLCSPEIAISSRALHARDMVGIRICVLSWALHARDT
ncbi:hypothetical protein PIB30_056732 [Stylosanthes scabra]|uniref:Transposase MuDR plant domain-containing protein n=1 Tax=Stylosanthes scabra TaxID=79078 RepID=A0ABU6YI78_9FABA|nr:hypothetical protein [Stylosanthes scabra]